MAPELVQGKKYNMAVDWWRASLLPSMLSPLHEPSSASCSRLLTRWSYGVLVYEMMTTRTPFFNQKGRKAIFQGIIKAAPKFPDHFSPEVSD